MKSKTKLSVAFVKKFSANVVKAITGPAKPVKLSKQESQIFVVLKARKTMAVIDLYASAVGGVRAMKMRNQHRRMQQHVGVLIARINAKQRKFVIKPGDEPRTYSMKRR